MVAAVLASLESKNSRDVTQWASFANASAKRRRVPRSRKGQCWPVEHRTRLTEGYRCGVSVFLRIGFGHAHGDGCGAGPHSGFPRPILPPSNAFPRRAVWPCFSWEARSRASSCMQRGAALLGVSLRKILEYQMHASILVLFACGPSSTAAGTTVFTEIVPLPCARGRSPPWSAS